MNPAVKYTLGRLGLFVITFVVLLATPLNILVSAMVALVVSAIASYFLLADWRNQMTEQLAAAATRRGDEKKRLRAALAGDEEAAAAGDRAAEPQVAVAEEPRATVVEEPRATVAEETKVDEKK